MKKLGKFKLFGFVIILMGALVIVGINYLEGKKPPKWEWQVGIPNEPKAELEDYNCNLYGNPHGNALNTPENGEYIIYENNDFVDVDFWTGEDRDTGEIHSAFTLKIENTEKDNPTGTGVYSIGFRDLQFIGCKSHCYLGREGPCSCWVFPNYPGVDCSGGEGCFDCDCTGTGSGGYGVMEDFMENYAHPSFGYDHFSLRFIVYHDIETIEEGNYWKGEGYMWRMNVWNTGDTLLLGDEKYHNIICQYSIPLEEVLVERSGEDEWEITVDQCGYNDPDFNNCPSLITDNSGRYIAFWEFYYQGIVKQRGKSGKSYIEPVGRRALGGATAFKFITKWTRF